jgi:hypothetical protein
MTTVGPLVPQVLDRLPHSYRAVFDRAVDVLFEDDRVRAMWLGGSLARGTADAASDLDVFAAIADEHHSSFAAAWLSLLDSITPTVLADEQWFAKGSFWSITPDFVRFDLVIEPVSAIPTSLFAVRTVIFDRDDLTAQLPAEWRRQPSATVVAKLIEDWFHFSAMLEVILWRHDWLLAAEHLHFLRDLLYKIHVEANQPLPATGLKRWTEKLTPEQARALRELPTSADSAEDLLSAHVTMSEAFLAAARPLAARIGVAWPSALEDAARLHLRAVTGLAEPYPG